MEQRDLTEYLSQETVLRLTEEAFSQRENKQKSRKLPRMAALAACLALVVTVVNFDTVYAAVQSLLYFLPGSGPVAEQSFPDYWVPSEEYAAATDEADYFVTYLYRWGDTLSLRVKKVMEGRDLMPEVDRYAALREAAMEPDGSAAPQVVVIPGFPQIAIRDGDGNLLELEDDASRDGFAVYSGDKAEFESEWEFPGFTLERFTLVLDGAVEFPVELRKIDAEDYAVSGGTTVRDQGYALTLLPLNDSCTRFAILSALEEPGKAPAESYLTPLSYKIAALGESGTVYEAESVSSRPQCQEFYLPALPEEKITSVTVTGILESTRYDEKKRPAFTLPALSPGEAKTLDQKLELWNDAILVEAAGLTKEGELWVRFRCREEGRHLNQLDLVWPEVSERDAALQGASDRQIVGQRHAASTDGDYTISVLDRPDLSGKEVTLTVSFVSVTQEGHWEFAVPVK